MKTIVLTGGGTAGHCTPHFALLKKLSQNFDKIYYIGSENGIEKRLVEEKGIPYFSIPTTKLKRKLTLSNLKIPFELIKSVKEAKKLLEKLKPSVIFSKGGFVGLPVAIAGHKLNIPVIIHESDKTLGLANKIASRFALNTLTTFSDTAKNVDNGIYLGAIIREELANGNKAKALSYYGFKSDKPTLLVTGGSSGAKRINEAVVKNLDKLLMKFNVLHLVGKNNLTGIKKEGYKEVEFADMQDAYAVSDICVSRAGSNTVFELLYLKIPTLLIPLPKDESRGDQIDNAEYFYNKGLCKRLFQKDIDGNFLNSIFDLYEDRIKLKDNISNYKTLIANDKIIEMLTRV
ncbi:MAG: undecaprenyldiphospho-muramoylpentapeptide beta-N-acetylglucosaminyltransferase [Clostridia bacterium]|nr:undecaprenyldiphospho-muramoylpentapeptide beta-N-acetylglucosaminyltransferase [Clostridia bacterium]